jgi:pSer/pThr/pTyr-binding forkhead associated (FHA) protein
MWILTTPEGTEPALTFRLLPGNIKTIGRAVGVDFIVDATLVSRVHCRLTAGANEVELIDLDSTNGTFVNGQPVQKRAVVKAGDRIAIGRVELTLSRSVNDETGTGEEL